MGGPRSTGAPSGVKETSFRLLFCMGADVNGFKKGFCFIVAPTYIPSLEMSYAIFHTMDPEIRPVTSVERTPENARMLLIC